MNQSGFHGSCQPRVLFHARVYGLLKVWDFVVVVRSVYCSQIVPFVTSIWNATVIIPYATIVTFSATVAVGAGDCHVMLAGLGRSEFCNALSTTTTGKRSGYICCCIYITRFNILE